MQSEERGLDKLEKTQNAPQSIKTVAHWIFHKLSNCF
jgi:hypothetical protein